MAAKGKVDVAAVQLWGRQVGAVRWDGRMGLGVFEYAPDFVAGGLQLSPIRMPLRREQYDFPVLKRSEDFHGMPGLLADCSGHEIVSPFSGGPFQSPRVLRISPNRSSVLKIDSLVA